MVVNIKYWSVKEQTSWVDFLIVVKYIYGIKISILAIFRIQLNRGTGVPSHCCVALTSIPGNHPSALSLLRLLLRRPHQTFVLCESLTILASKFISAIDLVQTSFPFKAV